MTENFYARCMGTENDLCVPIATPAVMNNIPRLAQAIVKEGKRPTLTIDLEHLQVCDYTRFELTSELQRATIQKLRQDTPIRADEMAFLAFRSMFTFVWPEPESADDVIRAATFERGLNDILTSAGLDYSTGGLHSKVGLAPPRLRKVDSQSLSCGVVSVWGVSDEWKW
jgi:hypothetical protein